MVPRVSFVMPNRNHASYLDRSVGGMLSQTRPADEILVIDDDSTDDSVAVIEAHRRRDPRLRLLRNPERRGVIATLNRGLAESTGDWIAFLGADDCVFPRFLKITAKLAERFPHAGLVCAIAEIWDKDDRVTGSRPVLLPTTEADYVPPERFRGMLRCGDNFFLGAVTIYRRDALCALGGFDPALGAMTDGVLARRLAIRHGFAFAPERLGAWRIHDYNYSVCSVTSEAANEAALGAFAAVLAAEPDGLFPPRYSALLARRQRFGSARLIAIGAEPDAEAAWSYFTRVVGGGALDRAVVRIARHRSRLGRLALLAWAAARLRPFSLPWLLHSSLIRWLRGRSRA